MNLRQAQFAIHLTALLFGLTGIFGELIQASPVLITAGRAAFASIALLLFGMRTGHMAWPRPRAGTTGARAIPVIVLAGLMLAAHWVGFFVSVKVAGVAIATLGFASFPAFITLFEGVLFRERTSAHDWGLVVLVTAGLVLVSPTLDLRNEATVGLLWGIGSGLAFALFTLANRKAITQMHARALAGWENVIVVGVTLPWCLTEILSLRALDWLWLFMLGVFCTALSHALLVASLERLKARTAGIVIALEPVYAILFAALLFAQYPSLHAILGGALIVGAILWSSTARRGVDSHQETVGPIQSEAPGEHNRVK